MKVKVKKIKKAPENMRIQCVIKGKRQSVAECFAERDDFVDFTMNTPRELARKKRQNAVKTVNSNT